MWPPRCLRLEFEEAGFEPDENSEPQPPRRRKRARRGVNPFIEAEACVDGDASGAEANYDGNDDFDRFIVADDDEF